MTAEKQPNLFVVLAKGMMIVSNSDFKDNDNQPSSSVFMDFDEAKNLALAFRKENNTPCEICMLSSLTGDITPESLNSPMLDYLPQHITAIENALANAKNNKDLNYRLEDFDKLMKILAGLGIAIDKAKEDQAIG